jgi:hypothetical protein
MSVNPQKNTLISRNSIVHKEVSIMIHQRRPISLLVAPPLQTKAHNAVIFKESPIIAGIDQNIL